MFEGVPNIRRSTGCVRLWTSIRSISSTAPTAIRALMAEGLKRLKARSASLRIMGSVGEPINPEAWEWYYKTIGDEHARSSRPGGRPNRRLHHRAMPGAIELKPGSATVRSSGSTGAGG
ncbi:hypothetical protein ACNKHW_26060 [Shigella flexneri]